MLDKLVAFAQDNNLYDSRYAFCQQQKVAQVLLDEQGNNYAPYLVIDENIREWIPEYVRTSGPSPYLGADNIKYALGLEKKKIDLKKNNIFWQWKIEQYKEGEFIFSDFSAASLSLNDILSQVQEDYSPDTLIKLTSSGSEIKVYKLGDTIWEEYLQEHHLFVNLLEEYYNDTKDQYAQSILHWLKGFWASKKHIKNIFDLLRGLKNEYIVFKVGAISFQDNNEILNWWYQKQSKEKLADKGKPYICIVCHQYKPAVSINPKKIKSLPGGKMSGDALISFNIDAFCSHKWEKNQNAPICLDCTLKYSIALRYMVGQCDNQTPGFSIGVRNEDDSLTLAWTRDKAELSYMDIDKPDSNQIKKLLTSVFSSDYFNTDTIASEDFYLLIIQARSGRIIIRKYIDLALIDIKKNISRWYQAQTLQNFPEEYIRIDELKNSLKPASIDPKKWRPDPVIMNSLLGFAYQGLSIPLSILATLIRVFTNNMKNNAIPLDNSIRLFQIIMVSQKLPLPNQEEKAHPQGAYHCGRLLAVLANLQYQALDETNTSLVTKFYSLASTRPNAAFPQLLQQAQHHLHKLGRTKKGSQVNIDKNIIEIMENIKDFSPVHSLSDQAYFALGYYHQRSEFFKKTSTIPKSGNLLVDDVGYTEAATNE